MPSQKPAACPLRARFGRNVASLREKRRLTQETLAEGAGVSARYLQSIEAGEYWPTLATLAKLKGVLKCSWDELLSGCDRV